MVTPLALNTSDLVQYSSTLFDIVVSRERIYEYRFVKVHDSKTVYRASPSPESSSEIRNKTSLHTEAGQLFAQQILDDCSAYFHPSLQAIMKKSTIKELRVGFVKHTELTSAYTKDSIYRMDSIIHSRLNTGVRCVAPGYITNASMKMIYAKNNATLIKEMIDQQARLLHHDHNGAQSSNSYTFFAEQVQDKLTQHPDHKPQLLPDLIL